MKRNREKGEYFCPECGGEVHIEYRRILIGTATVDPENGTAEHIDVEDYEDYCSILECPQCNWHVTDYKSIPEQFGVAVDEVCRSVDNEA